VLVGFALFSAQRGGGGASDFGFEVYQGAGVLEGSQTSLADVLSIGKPVVLNFWAGDCPPCRFEMPDLQRSYEAHGDEVIYLGMDVGVFTGLGSRQSALALLRELDITYPVGAPPDRTAVVDYRVTAMPTTVFFDAGGVVDDRWEGAITESQLDAIVLGMLR
jgi:thiol-disulfide isomerase/thioredoxin